jgi:hypothetical protein
MDRVTERVQQQRVVARERRAARRATYAAFARLRRHGMVRRHAAKLGLELPADRPHIDHS